MGQTRYPSKIWVFKSHFSFNVRQHGQQTMLNFLQNGRCCFILTNLLVYTTTPPNSAKNPFLYLRQFSPPFLPLLVHKTTLTTLPSSIPQQFVTFPIFAYSHPNNLYKNIFPTREQDARVSREDWHCFNLSLFPQSMTVITGLTTTDSL